MDNNRSYPVIMLNMRRVVLQNGRNKFRQQSDYVESMESDNSEAKMNPKNGKKIQKCGSEIKYHRNYFKGYVNTRNMGGTCSLQHQL